MIAYEIPSSWKRADCTDLCWQRYVQMAPGERRRVLTYHDLDGHQQAWTVARHHDVVATGPLVIDSRRHIVSIDGCDVYMTPTEYQILYWLGQRVGEVRHTKEILQGVWGIDGTPDSHTLRVNIARIRSRLGPAGSLIVNRMGVGYLLRNVEPCAAADLPADAMPLTYEEWKPAAPPTVPLGNKQLSILRVLRAAPERQLSVGHAATEGWGSATPKKCWAVVSSARKLQRRGYPIAVSLTFPRAQSVLRLTGDLPDDGVFV